MIMFFYDRWCVHLYLWTMHDNVSYDVLYAQVCMLYDMTNNMLSYVCLWSMHNNVSYDVLCAQVCMLYDMINKGLRVASLFVGIKSTLYDMTSEGLRVASPWGLRALFMIWQDMICYVMTWTMICYFTLYGLYQGWAP